MMAQIKVLLFTTLICYAIAGERVSVRKCLEYARLNGENADSRTNFLTTKFAGPKEFPHMALLGYQENEGDNITYVCSGSLISENFVLTAAHCLAPHHNIGDVKYVRLGDLDISKDDDDAKPLLFKVVESFTHESFTQKEKYNDIGLVKLETNVQFNQYIRPACLAQSFDNASGGRAFATGWGKTSFTDGPSPLLKKSVMEITPHETCQAEYAQLTRQLKDGIIDSQQICATAVNENEGTCQGDAGGPLQVYHSTARSMYTIIGITSFGKTCGSVGSADVFTRVYGYLDWIEARVWTN